MTRSAVRSPGDGGGRTAAWGRRSLWTGFGVWTQLWAMWTLPLAWGCGWQAIRHGRHRFWAVPLVALTGAFRFETGYLAFAPLVVWPLLAGGRPRRAALLGAQLTRLSPEGYSAPQIR